MHDAYQPHASHSTRALLFAPRPGCAPKVNTVADPQHQIERDVGAALKCAEEATWATNELVGRTLETAVTGKEAATTLHHAYSAQVHIARVLVDRL
jgi:hypothetical protein